MLYLNLITVQADDPSQAPYLSSSRSLSVTNRFSVPLAVHSALLAPEANRVFTLTKFKPRVRVFQSYWFIVIVYVERKGYFI